MAKPKMHPESDPRKPLTAERLRELLNYDPETGLFTWRVDRIPNRCKGTRAGNTHHLGYRNIRIDGRHYPESHLAWLYMTGEWPPADKKIDHKNRKRADNRWGNLRPATLGENQCNSLRVNRDLPRGVYPHGRSFRAQIRKHGRLTNLGTFPTQEEAGAAYADAAQRLHGEFVFVPTREGG